MKSSVGGAAANVVMTHAFPEMEPGMFNVLGRLAVAAALMAALSGPSLGQTTFPTANGSSVPGAVMMCLDSATGLAAPVLVSGSTCPGSGGGTAGNITQWASTTLGAPSNFGTTPGAVIVPGVNAAIISSALPTGAATATNQSSEITLLTAINTNIQAGTGTFGSTYPTSGLAPGLFDGTNLVRSKGDETNGAWVNVKASVSQAVTNAGTFATQSALTATEVHAGEIGSNQIRVDVAQTVTASSAYTSGNAIGGLMTVAGATRVSGSLGAAGTGGIIQQVVANSKSLQTIQVDVFLFNSNPTGSTCTDKTAFVLATADFDKVIGVASIPGTAANNSGWFGGGTGSVGQANNLAMAFDLASATSIYACAVTRGTPTFTATSDISFKYQILRN